MLKNYEILIDLVNSTDDWGSGIKIATDLLTVQAKTNEEAKEKANKLADAKYDNYQDYFIRDIIPVVINL